MPECEGEQGRKKDNGTQKCLETFTGRDYLERLPRDCIYPLVRQFLYCKLHTTWSEAQGTQTSMLQIYKSVHLESFIVVASPQRTEEVPSSCCSLWCLCAKYRSIFPSQRMMIFHSLLLISHCPKPNFEKLSSCLVFLGYDNPNK